jgi:dimethylargininase
MRAIVRGIPASFTQATVRVPHGQAIDVALARDQHARYVRRLRRFGVDVIELKPADDQPDCCFVEDQAVVVDGLALIARVGNVARRAETDAIADALAGCVEVHRMRDGNLDGGDVLRIGRTLIVGRGERTDAIGVRALYDQFHPRGMAIREVAVGDRLHLKCVATALDADTVVLAEGTLDPGLFAGIANVLLIPADEAYAANVVAVGKSVVMAAGYPTTAERIAARGWEVFPIDVSEMRKADGSLTCLSLLWE